MSENGRPDLIKIAAPVYKRGGAVVPIPRKGIEYGSDGDKKVTTGKGPDFTPGYLDRRFTWSELEKHLRSADIVALGIIGGSLSEGELHNLATLDFDGDGWQGAYDHFLEAWPEFRTAYGTITGSGKRHKKCICPDMPPDY